MNWRRSEFISLSTLMIVAGWIWWASAKTTVWDSTATMVKEMTPKVDRHSEEIAVLRDAVMDMKDDVKYLRRHARE